MGFRICYIASKLDPHEMASVLNLQIVGNDDEMPTDDWWIARLRQVGWTVLWSQDEEFGTRSSRRIADLSRKTDVVHCQINETTMWSSCEFWSNGRPSWKVSHAGDGDDLFDLNASGNLPSAFDAINEEHFAKQEAENEDEALCDFIFEIPLELARSYIGFRHEDVLESADVDAFHIVFEPARTGFLSRLFGRGSGS